MTAYRVKSWLRGNVTDLFGVLSVFGRRVKGMIRLRPEQMWTCNVTLHVYICSGRNRIIALIRRPNTGSTPNKPVTLPRNQLLICYVVTSPVHTHDTVLRYAAMLQVCIHLNALWICGKSVTEMSAQILCSVVFPRRDASLASSIYITASRSFYGSLLATLVHAVRLRHIWSFVHQFQYARSFNLKTVK